MKLDKIKFANLMMYLGRTGAFTLNEETIQTIDNLIDVEVPIPIEHHYPKNDDVERLMALMAEGTRKIEAIKIYRILTGMGLKESKDTVERYWVAKPEPVKSNLDVDNFGVRNVDPKDVTLGDILHSAGRTKAGNNIG